MSAQPITHNNNPKLNLQQNNSAMATHSHEELKNDKSDSLHS